MCASPQYPEFSVSSSGSPQYPVTTSGVSSDPRMGRKRQGNGWGGQGFKTWFAFGVLAWAGHAAGQVVGVALEKGLDLSGGLLDIGEVWGGLGSGRIGSVVQMSLGISEGVYTYLGESSWEEQTFMSGFAGSLFMRGYRNWQRIPPLGDQILDAAADAVTPSDAIINNVQQHYGDRRFDRGFTL